MAHTRRSKKEETTDKPQKPLPTWMKVVGVIAGISFIGGVIGNMNDDEPETTQAEASAPAEETAEDTPEETPPEEAPDDTPKFKITHDADDFSEAGGTTFVEFEISDNFSQGLIASGAQRNTFEALETAVEEYPETGRVQIIGSFPTADEYGNEEMSDILQPVYLRETIDQINFGNWATIDIWALRDGGMVNQQLMDNR